MDRLLTVNEVAELLRISPHTLRSWIWGRRELGRKCIRVGRSIRFRPSDVERWLNDRMFEVDDSDSLGECGNERF
jgi:excisionase family DNA binding protein